MTFLRRLWHNLQHAVLSSRLARRFRHADWTYAEPWRKRTYCEMLGHKWGGWRRDKRLGIYTRRCRRRRCPQVEGVTPETLVKYDAHYSGGRFVRNER
jgi:hypothetical protein